MLRFLVDIEPNSQINTTGDAFGNFQCVSACMFLPPSKIELKIKAK